MSRVVFVTGTNTGAGKTILTSLLLAHLRSIGIQALAMKPVETGVGATHDCFMRFSVMKFHWMR